MIAPAKLTDCFIEAEIEDEIVVMRLDNGEFFGLSGTGAAIWRLIDGSRDVDALVTALAKDFAGDTQVVVDDVNDFLRQLAEMGLLARD